MKPLSKSIYDLELHEEVYGSNPGTRIMKVEGGWIYKFSENTKLVSTVFVPLNTNEIYRIGFKQEEKEGYPIKETKGITLEHPISSN